MQLKLVQPPPELSAQVDGDHRTWVEAPPWVIRANRIPNEQEHFLRIEFYQSNVEDCARPGSQSVEVEGNEIAATLTLQQPPDVPWDTGCAEEFVELDAVEPIPSELSSDKPYKDHRERCDCQHVHVAQGGPSRLDHHEVARAARRGL